jgi:acetyl esterase/lipase
LAYNLYIGFIFSSGVSVKKAILRSLLIAPLALVAACSAGQDPVSKKKSNSYTLGIGTTDNPVVVVTPSPTASDDPDTVVDPDANFKSMMAAARVIPGQANVKVVRDLHYGDPTDAAQVLDIYYPVGWQIGMPLVIYAHSGGWRDDNKNGSAACKNLYTDANCQCRASVLANAGLAVACMDYHLTSETPAKRFPQQIWDMKAAVRYLRANAVNLGVDSENFIAFGVAAGGQMASLVGASAGVARLEGDPSKDLTNPGYSSSVQAVIDFSGFTDLAFPYHSDAIAAINAYLGTNAYSFASLASPAASAAAALQSFSDGTSNAQTLSAGANPINYVGSASPPMLIMHGQDETTITDTAVRAAITIPYASSRDLYAKLTASQPASTLLCDPATAGYAETDTRKIRKKSCMFMISGVYSAGDAMFWSRASLNLVLNFIRTRMSLRVLPSATMPN